MIILEEMCIRYRVLNAFKSELIGLGHNFKKLAYINGQLDLLSDLIKEESFAVLDELLRKTNYRLLKDIDRGMENIIEIYNNPYDWQLAELEGNNQEWFNEESLVFSTERQTLVFSKNIDGQKYLNNKWQ